MKHAFFNAALACEVVEQEIDLGVAKIIAAINGSSGRKSSDDLLEGESMQAGRRESQRGCCLYCTSSSVGDCESLAINHTVIRYLACLDTTCTSMTCISNRLSSTA